MKLLHHRFFRPLIRGFFFYCGDFGERYDVTILRVSVPLFGDSFFINHFRNAEKWMALMFPSPYSGILFLWTKRIILSICHTKRFRPLIRGFFFYVLKCVQHYSEENKAFPSPYSGILFLSDVAIYPSIDGELVSVPLFGDSFFIKSEELRIKELNRYGFPSPYSGILFLSVQCK